MATWKQTHLPMSSSCFTKNGLLPKTKMQLPNFESEDKSLEASHCHPILSRRYFLKTTIYPPLKLIARTRKLMSGKKILSFWKKGFLEGPTGLFQGGVMFKLHILHDAWCMISVLRKIVLICCHRQKMLAWLSHFKYRFCHGIWCRKLYYNL